MTAISIKSSHRSVCAFQRGQSSTEYLIVCAALAVALGVGMVDDNSVLRQLLNAFAQSYQKISFAISLP
jgi:hypothetical protein